MHSASDGVARDAKFLGDDLEGALAFGVERCGFGCCRFDQAVAGAMTYRGKPALFTLGIALFSCALNTLDAARKRANPIGANAMKLGNLTRGEDV